MVAVRLSPEQRHQRNQLIVEAYNQKDQTGETPFEIAVRHSVSVPLLNKIISKASKREPQKQQCLEPGCQAIAKARELCGKHYQQWWRANLPPEKRHDLAKSQRTRQQKYYEKGKAQVVSTNYAETPKGQAARSRSKYWSKVLWFLNQRKPDAIAQRFPTIPTQSIQTLTQNRPLTWAKIRQLLPQTEVEAIRAIDFDTEKKQATRQQLKRKINRRLKD